MPKRKREKNCLKLEDELLDKMIFKSSEKFLQNLENAEKKDGLKIGSAGTDSDEDVGSNKPCAWKSEDNEITVGQALKAQGRRLPEGGINDPSNKYTELLKHKFESINGRPKWAKLDRKEEDSDEDDDILQTCGITKKQPSIYLPSSTLEYKEIKHLNCETYNEGPYINCIEFFNDTSVALVAGQSGIASLYGISGKKSTKLHSVKYENFPIFCSKIIEADQQVIFGSRLPFIHYFDLKSAKSTKFNLPPGLTTCKKFNISSDQTILAIAGKFGEIHLLSAHTKERIGVLKQNGEATALSFGSKNNLLYAHSNCGEITIFDINMRRVKHRFIDEGCLQGTTLAISPSERFLAAGSAQGVVNLYDTNCIYKSERPKPQKALLNLTTKISSLAFNCTSELLGYASNDIPNSVKLYHLGDQETIKNFPNFSTKFGHVNVVNFSPNSGFFAIGNSRSTVSLCRLKYYNNY